MQAEPDIFGDGPWLHVVTPLTTITV